MVHENLFMFGINNLYFPMIIRVVPNNDHRKVQYVVYCGSWSERPVQKTGKSKVKTTHTRRVSADPLLSAPSQRSRCHILYVFINKYRCK